MDIYSLIDIFDGCGLAQAVSIVGTWFGAKLQPFESAGTGPVKGYRYAVPAEAIYELLGRYPSMRHQHVEDFIREAVQLVRGCALVPWHGRLFDEDRAFLSQKLIGNLFRIKSAAAKAYLWLLIQQEETARNTKGEFSISDAQVAHELGVSKTTAAKYREQVQEQGLVRTVVEKVGKIGEIRIKRVKY